MMKPWKLYLGSLVLLFGCATAAAQFVGPPQNVVSDSDANQPFALHVKTFGADTVAITGGSIPAGLTSIVTGQQAVTAVATALPSNAGRIICVRVIDTGTQTVSYGPSGVTTATGQQLVPGEGMCRPLDNSNRIFVIAGGVGSTVGFDVYN